MNSIVLCLPAGYSKGPHSISHRTILGQAQLLGEAVEHCGIFLFVQLLGSLFVHSTKGFGHGRVKGNMMQPLLPALSKGFLLFAEIALADEDAVCDGHLWKPEFIQTDAMFRIGERIHFVEFMPFIFGILWAARPSLASSDLPLDRLHQLAYGPLFIAQLQLRQPRIQGLSLFAALFQPVEAPFKLPSGKIYHARFTQHVFA